MSPLTAAGVLAAAYSLGLLPKDGEGMGHAAVAGLLGYGVGHDDTDKLQAALARSEHLRLVQAQEAHAREQALRQAFAQQLQAVAQAAQDGQIHEALRQAAAAHSQGAHPTST